MSEKKSTIQWSEAFAIICKGITEKRDYTDEELYIIKHSLKGINEHFKNLDLVDEIGESLDKIKPKEIDRKTMSDALKNIFSKFKDKCIEPTEDFFKDKIIEPVREKRKEQKEFRKKKKEAIRKIKEDLNK